jgi:prepilin-type N-terminal cleavage/methylation domain-containing protein
MTRAQQKGFTLIELLVVIAIIGLLAAVVLASLNSARAKGADAAIKADLRNAMSQAEIVYDDANPNSYALVCTNANIVAQMTQATQSAGNTYTLALAGTAQSATNIACHAAAGTYVIATVLKSSNLNSWCVDNTGASKQETGSANYLAAAATACP